MGKLANAAILFLVATAVEAGDTPAAAAAVPARHTMTFLDIVISGGAAVGLLWIVLVLMFMFVLLFGLLSIVSAAMAKTNTAPLTLKLLYLAAATQILAGAAISALGIVRTINTVLGPLTGASKARALALSISDSLYAPSLALLGLAPFFFFAVLAMSILHFKPSPAELAMLESDS